MIQIGLELRVMQMELAGLDLAGLCISSSDMNLNSNLRFLCIFESFDFAIMKIFLTDSSDLSNDSS